MRKLRVRSDIDFELKAQAVDLVEQLTRLGIYDGGIVNKKWMARFLAAQLQDFEDRVKAIASRSEPQSIKGYFNESAAVQFRRENIKADRGYREGCDSCGNNDQTALSLKIGGFHGRLRLNMCRKCGERLVSTVDARLTDGHHADNRRRG